MAEPDFLSARMLGLGLLVLGVLHGLFAFLSWSRRPPAITAHFSPRGGCAEAIVKEVDSARFEVLVMAYSFSCPDIANSLIAAAARGVRVTILLDRSNEAESYSQLSDLQRHKLEVLIDACHAIAHNKVIVIDHHTIITGSFNFTRQAEHENAENLLILRHNRELAALYRTNFHSHREHCIAPGNAKASTGPHFKAAAHSRHVVT